MQILWINIIMDGPPGKILEFKACKCFCLNPTSVCFFLSAIAWCWSRRSRCLETTSTQCKATHDHQSCYHKRFAVSEHHYSRHIVGVPTGNVGWLRGQNETRYNNDIHMFRPVRYVQCAQLPFANQEYLQNRLAHQQNVPVCRCIFVDRSAAGHLFPAVANGIPDRGANSIRFDIFDNVDLVGVHCIGIQKMVRTDDGATHVQN